MTNIYNKVIESAKKTVTNASNMELSSDTLNERIFNSLKIKPPKINLEQTNVQIKVEEISFRNAPPGIAFSTSGPTLVECAIYGIPISGDMDLFASIIQPLIDRRKTYLEYSKLFYKEYSNDKISGNEDLINSIKKRVVSFTTSVNNLLLQFEQQANQFNETNLKPTITQLIESEIIKRNLKSDSESKLNPFA